jgi:hypothetical protein
MTRPTAAVIPAPMLDREARFCKSGSSGSPVALAGTISTQEVVVMTTTSPSFWVVV